MPRVAFLTNMIPPYHKPVLDVLSARFGGLRVLISTPMESNRPWKLEWDGLDVVVQKTITLRGRWRHPKGFSEPLFVHVPIDTVQQLRKYRADVVISGEMGARTLFALLYRKLNRHSKLIVWAEVAESTEQGRGRSRRIFRSVLHPWVDAFLVTGESGARYMRSLGVDDRKIFKISYTTQLTPFMAVPLSRGEEHAKRLLYVGQLIERKGLEPFVDVLSKWASANQTCRIELILAGDGPLRARLQNVAVPQNVKIEFLGNVPYENLPEIYGAAEIFVLPTLADTWGVVVNEAMAAGLSVLGSLYSQAVMELVKDGQNGWTFRADDASETYDAIDRSLKTSVGKLSEMRKCARDTAARLTPHYVAGLIENAVAACWNNR